MGTIVKKVIGLEEYCKQYAKNDQKGNITENASHNAAL